MATGQRLTHITKGGVYEILYVSKYKEHNGDWIDVLSYMSAAGEVFNRRLDDLEKMTFIN